MHNVENKRLKMGKVAKLNSFATRVITNIYNTNKDDKIEKWMGF